MFVKRTSTFSKCTRGIIYTESPNSEPCSEAYVLQIIFRIEMVLMQLLSQFRSFFKWQMAEICTECFPSAVCSPFTLHWLLCVIHFSAWMFYNLKSVAHCHRHLSLFGNVFDLSITVILTSTNDHENVCCLLTVGWTPHFPIPSATLCAYKMTKHTKLRTIMLEYILVNCDEIFHLKTD